jgi:hypothetical protein
MTNQGIITRNIKFAARTAYLKAQGLPGITNTFIRENSWSGRIANRALNAVLGFESRGKRLHYLRAYYGILKIDLIDPDKAQTGIAGQETSNHSNLKNDMLITEMDRRIVDIERELNIRPARLLRLMPQALESHRRETPLALSAGIERHDGLFEQDRKKTPIPQSVRFKISGLGEDTVACSVFKGTDRKTGIPKIHERILAQLEQEQSE